MSESTKSKTPLNDTVNLEYFKQRSESAESALKNAREVLTMHIESGTILDKIDAHVDKYCTQKDPLWPLFNEFYVWDTRNAINTENYNDQRKQAFDKFKEIFADELNGTKGLDEAIERFTLVKPVKGNIFNSDMIVDELEEIKSKLEAKS